MKSVGHFRNHMKTLNKYKNTRRGDDRNTAPYKIDKLPPKWVDKLEETREMINRINGICQEIQQLKQKGGSTSMQAVQEQSAQNKLDIALQVMYIIHIKMIGDIEYNLQQFENDDDEEDYQMKQYAKISLGIQLKDVTPQLRQYQREILQQLQIDRPPQNQLQKQQLLNENFNEEYLQNIALDRNEKIQRLGDKIRKMADLFKEMNRLVIEQGTLLDRIDFNIEQTYQTVTKGKQQLKEANQRQMVSSRAQKCICILVGLNVLFVLILIIKFTF